MPMDIGPAWPFAAKLGTRRLPQINPAGRSSIDGATSPRILQAASRARAEEGVRLAYNAAGLRPPQIHWCDGPRELAASWAAAVSADVGNSARDRLLGDPSQTPWPRLDGSTRAHAGLMRTLFRNERKRMTSAAVQGTVLDELGNTRPPLLAWMQRPEHSGKIRLVQRPTFADAGLGPRDICGGGLDAAPPLRAIRKIAEHVGWIVPHAKVCWLSTRPDVLSIDSHGRLHCGDGPALSYSDGLVFYAWKGAVVPPWLITHPEKLSLHWIDAQIDQRLRHAMIDIFTPLRFISEGGAACAAKDAYGTLWKRQWTHRGAILDAWAALETATDLVCVPPRLATPRQAVAWLKVNPAG